MASARTTGLCIPRHSTSASRVHIDECCHAWFPSCCATRSVDEHDTTLPDVSLFSKGCQVGSSAIICLTVSRLLLALPFINPSILTLPTLLCSSTVAPLPLRAISAWLLAFTAVCLCVWAACRLCSRVGFRLCGIVSCVGCFRGGGGCLMAAVGRVIKASLGLQRYRRAPLRLHMSTDGRCDCLWFWDTM